MREILAEWRALDTSKKALRSFGWTVGAVVLALAAFALWRRGGAGGGLPAVLGGIGAALVLLGTVGPAALRPVYRVWMLLAVGMGFVMTRVLLTAVFFLVATPLGLVRRALGHDPMRRRRPDGSLWIRRPPPGEDGDARDARRRLEHTF